MHFLLFLMGAAMASDVYDRVEHGYADSNGVKIHYASLGQGPLVVMIHGFPDFWYSWRDQMEALSSDFQTVALDLRGYNLSDKPAGVESYAMPLLVGDVAAVIRHLGKEKAIVVGHDWGGAVAWFLALTQPQLVEKLVILNLPHPERPHARALDQSEAVREQRVRARVPGKRSFGAGRFLRDADDSRDSFRMGEGGSGEEALRGGVPEV